jgi:hypothetical protein
VASGWQIYAAGWIVFFRGWLKMKLVPEDLVGRPAKFVASLIALMFSVQVLADSAEPGYRVTRSPTMAVFYTVGSDDTLTREKLSVETIADPDASRSRLVVGLQSNDATRGKARLRKSASMQTRETHYSASDAYRCERHRLYYTNDGRCIRPVYRVKRASKHTGAEKPLPHMQKSPGDFGANKNSTPRAPRRAKLKH